MAAKDELGRRGEALAAEYLIARGFTLLEANWRCAQGEIDLVMRDGGETVFVEVKTRTSTAYGHPLEAITPLKLARMHRLAMAWCRAHPGSHQVRLDAVAIVAGRGVPTFDHLRGVR